MFWVGRHGSSGAAGGVSDPVDVGRTLFGRPSWQRGTSSAAIPSHLGNSASGIVTRRGRGHDGPNHEVGLSFRASKKLRRCGLPSWLRFERHQQLDHRCSSLPRCHSWIPFKGR